MAGKGGKRPGAGRKFGVKNKATLERERIAERTGITPREYMLAIMRDEKEPKSRRDFMAVSVAPYIHPRLTSVDVNDITPRRDFADIDARILEVMRAISEGRVARVAGVARDSRSLILDQTVAHVAREEE